MDKEFRVVIPDEKYQILNFENDGLPGVAVVNSNLGTFEPKEVFAWHCSIMINCESLVENGMPSEDEVQILNEFGDSLDDKIKGKDKEKPNGLFLARITWNGTREIIWRIFDPKITNAFLTDIIEREDHLRTFDFRIDPDTEWKLAEWHLKHAKK